MKKKPILNLKSIGKTYEDILNFGETLLKSPGSDIVKYESKNELLYHLLKQISPISKSIKCSEKSIENACKIILTQLSFFDSSDAKIFLLDTQWNEVELSQEEQPQSNSDIFCKSVLRINFLPYQKYIYLQKMVDEDIKNISDLIQKYEKNVVIKNIIKNDGKTRNHTERMYRDYYQRCLSERINILNYKLYDLIPNAVNKSRGSRGLIKNMGFINSHMDVPYKFGRSSYDHYFDIDKMDLVSHRISEFYVYEGKNLFHYYHTNKQKFYKIYFNRKSVKECFIQIQEYLTKLEILRKRIVICNELEKLYKSKKWIGFYALALPQIEGLFSEMCSILFNDSANTSVALPDKVEKVRSYYYLEKAYFDYFQYFIPIQRNKFMHTGYDENFKLKSYDLITDILFLLQTIFELENPIIILHNIVEGKKKHYFSVISDYIKYFNLIKSVTGGKKQNIHNEIISKVKIFEKETLSKMPVTEKVCLEVINNIEDKIINFNTLGIDFNKIECILNSNEKLNEVKEMFKERNYYLHGLNEYYLFLCNVNSHLSNVKEEYLSKLTELDRKYRKYFKNILYIDNKTSQ